jgi:hypothetical protein
MRSQRSHQMCGHCSILLKEELQQEVWFADMLNAWCVGKLASVENLGDYIFKIEFMKEVEKAQAIEGWPWWHKGDTLIIVHYDGLVRPSEIWIESISLWVRFYDLPMMTMKEIVAKQLGGS